MGKQLETILESLLEPKQSKIEVIGDLFAKKFKLIKGKTLFIGKALDSYKNDVVLISEETSLEQDKVFNGRPQWETMVITIRTVVGGGYPIAQGKALEIYDYFRNEISLNNSFITANITRPVFTDKVNGVKFKFNMLLTLTYNTQI